MLKVKRFLDPLHGTGRNAADLGSVPYRLTALQAFGDGGVLGGELVESLDAPVRSAHTHTLFDSTLL